MNGIPQLMIPSLSNAAQSLGVLAQGLAQYYLATEQKWGVFIAGTGSVVSLGQKSSMIDQLKNGAGLTQLANDQLQDGENYIDSVLSLAVRKGSEVSSYRLETGSFANYNKVEKPRMIPIRLIKGGTESERMQFLMWLELESKRTKLYDIAVPELTYKNLTLIDYSIMRETRSGATLIIADCMFQEIMQITFQYVQSGTNNAKDAADKPPTETANLVPNSPSPSPLSKLGDILDKVL